MYLSSLLYFSNSCWAIHKINTKTHCTARADSLPSVNKNGAWRESETWSQAGMSVARRRPWTAVENCWTRSCRCCQAPAARSATLRTTAMSTWEVYRHRTGVACRLCRRRRRCSCRDSTATSATSCTATVPAWDCAPDCRSTATDTQSSPTPMTLATRPVSGTTAPGSASVLEPITVADVTAPMPDATEVRYM